MDSRSVDEDLALQCIQGQCFINQCIEDSVIRYLLALVSNVFENPLTDSCPTIVNMISDAFTRLRKSVTCSAPAFTRACPLPRVLLEKRSGGRSFFAKCACRFNAIFRPIDPKPYCNVLVHIISDKVRVENTQPKRSTFVDASPMV